MGGHAAWKKRIAKGELAKGGGGAIARHRPRWGRKGKDIELNRKGNIAGGNPKKRKQKSDDMKNDIGKNNVMTAAEWIPSLSESGRFYGLFIVIGGILILLRSLSGIATLLKGQQKSVSSS